MVIRLDMIQSLALAGAVLLGGYATRHRVPVLERYRIPAPVVGGLVFSSTAFLLRQYDVTTFELDTTLQTPLMIAFFTTVGLGADVKLFKAGGPQVLLFWILATALACLQDALGIALSGLLGVHPFLGLIAGSITMTGGHGTGVAFGTLMENQFGFAGGVGLAMAAATFGLVAGGLLGGPLATTLLRRYRPVHRTPESRPIPDGDDHSSVLDTGSASPARLTADADALLTVVTVTLLAMWVGSSLSQWLSRLVTLPAYIGAMLVAAVIRNGGDLLSRWRIDQRVVEDVGTVSLSLFLAMALMSLRLWELLDLAVPMLIILVAQAIMMAAFAFFVTFRFMGGDYDAAVMAGGHCGFGLGATPNAVANMEAITEHYGPAPRAFLVVPLVGAFFIDFTNAVIITTFVNWVT
jgi:ESS family glutamate:Na+ symporter